MSGSTSDIKDMYHIPLTPPPQTRQHPPMAGQIDYIYLKCSNLNETLLFGFFFSRKRNLSLENLLWFEKQVSI